MTSRKNKRTRAAPPAASAPRQPAPRTRLHLAFGLAFAALSVIVAAWWTSRAPPKRAAQPSAPAPVALEASFIGSAACADCHRAETEAWKASHHARAMQHANDATVLGDFDNASFDYNGITSTFFRRDGKRYVRTDGADGKLAEFEIPCSST